MTQKEFKVHYQSYEALTELSKDLQAIMESARNAVHDAYNPYSKFYVGCAVLLSNNQIITGFNIENAAYSVCICAERTTLSSALTQYPNEKIMALAVSTFKVDGSNNSPAFPCGVCRQFISECEDRNDNKFPIIISGQAGEIIVLESIKDLLPFSFGKNELEK